MSAREFCYVEASTRRAVVSGNRLTAAVTHLTSLMITPLWPVGQGTIRMLDLNSPRETKETYHVPQTGVSLPDVKEGDILVIGANEYPVDAVMEWTDNAIPCLHIVVGEVKTT